MSRLGASEAAELFARSTLDMSRALLDYELVHEQADGITVGRIVEVEAYHGPTDRAAHSYGGRRTARTEVMYGPAGRAYIFRIYGMYCCFNVVSAGEEEPQAILVRALEPVDGLEIMARRRKLKLPAEWDPRKPPVAVRNLTAGPGRLCQALAIDMTCYGLDLRASPLYLRRAPQAANARDIARGPRINVDYAGEDAALPWRFWLKGNPWVSVKPR